MPVDATLCTEVLNTNPTSRMGSSRLFWFEFLAISIMLLFSCSPSGWAARAKNDAARYGLGLTVNIPASESDVLKAVHEVVKSGMIHGTKEYSKDEFVGGAVSVESSTAFPAWTEGGKVFYKVRQNALDPRNFKDTNDVGTITVRYVVIAQGEKNTVLRIDAVFVEDFRRRAHASDGSVENAEYKDIHDRVEAMQLMRDRTAEAERERQKAAQAKFDANDGSQMSGPAPEPVPETVTEKRETRVADTASIEEIQKKIHELQQQIQKKVKAGTTLKSAPFHTAATLRTLTSGSEVLIVISTPYWYGVETRDGQHGWLLRDDLEDVP